MKKKAFTVVFHFRTSSAIITMFLIENSHASHLKVNQIIAYRLAWKCLKIPLI